MLAAFASRTGAMPSITPGALPLLVLLWLAGWLFYLPMALNVGGRGDAGARCLPSR